MKPFDRSIIPSIRPFQEIRFPEPEHFRLANGVPVSLFQSDTPDIIRIEFVFDAGTWYQQKPFVAFATNQMLRESSVNYTSDERSERLDFFGAHIETTVERDKATVTLYTLSKYLPQTIAILEDSIKNPVFTQDDLAVVAQKQKQVLTVNLRKVNYLARIHFNAALFGENHPYGSYLMPDQMDDVTSSDLKNFHATHYSSANCKILVAGKIPSQLCNLLEKLFGGNDWHRELSKKVEIPEMISQPETLFIEKQGALQSAIRIGKVLFSKKHPEYIDFQILNTILGGYFGSRLIHNLRKSKGYTYNVSSDFVSLQHSGYFFVTSEVAANHTREAVKEIYSELEQLCIQKVSDEELERVRNYLLGTFLHSIDGAFAFADCYRELMDFGLDTNWLKTYLDRIAGITSEEIRQTAQKYFGRENMTQVVVGIMN